MPRLPRILLATGTALLAALALGACGGAKQPSAHGDSEGAYVEAGPLVYQVQLSRELNPQNREDREYLAGLPLGTPQPAGDEEWFGVWLRVENDGKAAQQAAQDFRIVDTLGDAYEPIALPASNAFAYQPSRVAGKDGQNVLPDPESGAGGSLVQQGAMLLFKLKTAVYANRPLELEITPPDGGEASTVELDL